MDLLPEEASVFWKSNRLKSYKNWPFKAPNKCNPESMAAAGFIAIGGKSEPDLVECFICNKQLDGWDPDDDPWDEHVKHQPSCAFVKLGKQNETSWTVSELFNLLKVYLVKEYMREVEQAKELVKEECEKLIKEIPNAYKSFQKRRNSSRTS